MTRAIAVLPSHVIDQIAAGEVIERPASVVKELVDNAIDAGARAIVVEVTGGGRGSIRVTDDGTGMSAADARLALQRHATSKLTDVDELWGIGTLGFRGEALPSIASVARMTLTTRRAEDLAATRLAVEAGKIVSSGEVGAPVGTTVEIADLLFNVPARLKFLKGEATEASHVTEAVARIAMAYPQLHLRLRHNGRTALELPPDRDGFARAQALLGSRIAPRLIAAAGEEGGVRVSAYLAAPELAQTTARGVQLFVGRRPVRDRGLLHAVTMGYGELVPRGRYPIAVVLVDVPGPSVDVNVHPQKAEVRFSDAAAVAAAVRHVVQAAVASARWREETNGGGPVQMIATIAPPALPLDGATATPLAERYAKELRSAQVSLGLDPPRSVTANYSAREWVRAVRESGRAAKDRDAREAAIDAAAARASAELRGALPAIDARPLDGYFSALRYLGQLDLTYLVCESDGELVLVDQHAAHERVELARLRASHVEHQIAVQRMLFPVTLEATPAQLELVDRVGALLATVGFEVEPFGKSTLAVKAVPAGIRHGDPAQLLRGLLAEWSASGVPSESARLETLLGEIACHSVVRAGDRLSPSEAEALLRSLDGLDLSLPAPHNRAVLLRLALPEIGRRFGR